MLSTCGRLAVRGRRQARPPAARVDACWWSISAARHFNWLNSSSIAPPTTQRHLANKHRTRSNGDSCYLPRDATVVGGAENAGSENAGPSRNAASICCVCMAEWTVTFLKGIGVILSLFFNEYAAIKDIYAYGRSTCIPLQCLKKHLFLYCDNFSTFRA